MSFCKAKGSYYWKHNFGRLCVWNLASGLAKNPKHDNDITIFWHHVNVKFFWRCFVSLANFSYWSKFHVNIITGSGIMTIFFYNGLTRNLQIGNTPVWVFPNIWRQRRVMDAKFGINVSNRMFVNVAKFQGYSFYRFWVIKEKPTGGKINSLPPLQIRVKWSSFRLLIVCGFSQNVLKISLKMSSKFIWNIFVRKCLVENFSVRNFLVWMYPDLSSCYM